jgi:hypothetical protein
MENKEALGLILGFFGTFGATAVATLWKKARDVFFVLMIFLAPMTEDFDVNFMSRDFYRGTTRGIEFSCVDILSISLFLSCLIWPRKGESRGYWPASFGWMLFFFAYACFNVGISEPRIFGIFELSKMIRGMTIFLAVAFYLRSERELKLFLYALGAIITYEGYVALKQRVIYHMERVPGTVDDSNSLSVLLVLTVPMLIAAINSQVPKKLKALCAVAVCAGSVGMLLTLSRMGIMILLLMLLVTTLVTVSYKLTTTKIVGVALTLVIGSAGLYKNWAGMKERFGETSLGREYGNNRTLGRGYYLREAKAIIDDKLFGVGLNNWSYWVSQKYGPLLGYKFVRYRGTDIEPSSVIPPGSNVDAAQAAPAHCLAALMAGELGIPGLIIFMLVWLRWLQMSSVFLWKRTTDPMRRIGVGIFFGLCALFLQSLTEWVFRHSPIYYMIHIMLGVLASLYYIRRQERKAAKRAQVEQSIESPESETPETESFGVPDPAMNPA